MSTSYAGSIRDGQDNVASQPTKKRLRSVVERSESPERLSDPNDKSYLNSQDFSSASTIEQQDSSIDKPKQIQLGLRAKQSAPECSSSASLTVQTEKKENDAIDVGNPHTRLDLQPDSRLRPESDLAAEIKAIYFCLVLVEAKCIGVVDAENKRTDERTKEEKLRGSGPPEWPALLALHRALLQEHIDFILASQHPMSGSGLRSLAAKYSMPKRMLTHGIYSFLELLRQWLPSSIEYMHPFLILAHETFALLYETNDSYKDTWLEALGDIARYRMAIEEDDLEYRKIFNNVSRSWYSKASLRNVNIGRLYHHQALLARAQPLEQLSLFARSLAAVQPFDSARESILTLFDPILSRLERPGSRFIRLVAMQFTRKHTDRYQSILDKFITHFDKSIDQAGYEWRITGEFMAVTLLASILMWGEREGTHRVFVRKQSGPVHPDGEYQEHLNTAQDCKSRSAREWHLLKEMLVIALKRRNDENVLTFIYVIICFLWGVSSVEYGPEYLDDYFPWKQLSRYLNHLQQEKKHAINKHEGLDIIVLAEEQRMKGQAWTYNLFKSNSNVDIDSEEEDYQEPPSPLVPEAQKDRILSLCETIASKGTEYAPAKIWLFFNQSTGQFSATVARKNDIKSHHRH